MEINSASIRIAIVYQSVGDFASSGVVAVPIYTITCLFWLINVKSKQFYEWWQWDWNAIWTDAKHKLFNQTVFSDTIYAIECGSRHRHLLFVHCNYTRVILLVLEVKWSALLKFSCYLFTICCEFYNSCDNTTYHICAIALCKAQKPYLLLVLSILSPQMLLTIPNKNERLHLNCKLSENKNLFNAANRKVLFYQLHACDCVEPSVELYNINEINFGKLFRSKFTLCWQRSR